MILPALFCLCFCRVSVGFCRFFYLLCILHGIIKHIPYRHRIGPMSIHEMLSDVKAELLPFIPDYRINLIAPADMSEASLDKFNTSLREVLLYIKYFAYCMAS